MANDSPPVYTKPLEPNEIQTIMVRLLTAAGYVGTAKGETAIVNDALAQHPPEMVIACAAALVRAVAGRYGNEPGDRTFNAHVAGWLIDDARKALGDAVLGGEVPTVALEEASAVVLQLCAMRLAHPGDVPEPVEMYDKAVDWVSRGAAKGADMATLVTAAVHAIAWFAQVWAMSGGDPSNARQRALALLDRLTCELSESVWK